jgi:GTP-binding protein
VVAIVGRPNVGKSSLFNMLVGKRISIVDPTAGVTRDRVSTLAEYDGHYFELTDTGGIGIVDVDDLEADVEKQIQTAIDLASVILFVVDARSGPVPLDETVVDRLRIVQKPVLCVVNKSDSDVIELQASEFHRFGIQPVIAVSAEQHRGKDRLLTEIVKRLPKSSEEAPPAPTHLKLAIVGRRNAGKSTFINSLAQADRVIVSEVPGTTRDSVDVRFERDGKTFVAIDTAGVRNRSSLANSIEFYSMARAERSIRRADVVLHFFDARLKISRVDKQLTEYVLEHHKPAVFVINKWDLAKEQVSTEVFGEYVKKTFPMLDFVPIAFTTAADGKNVYKVLNLAQALAKQSAARVSTGELNRVLRWALEKNPPTTKMKRLPKIFFGTQIASQPPTIVLFANNPELFDNVYRKYLLNTFRDQLPFSEVPIKLEIRSRHASARDEPADAENDESTDTPAEKPAKKVKKTPQQTRRARKNNSSTLWDM